MKGLMFPLLLAAALTFGLAIRHKALISTEQRELGAAARLTSTIESCQRLLDGGGQDGDQAEQEATALQQLHSVMADVAVAPNALAAFGPSPTGVEARLSGLSLPQLGSLLDTWRQQHPSKAISSIQIAPVQRRSGASGANQIDVTMQINLTATGGPS
ncbi:MAG: hypothetical protein AAGB51_15155 [Planctomycetota bacterium]